MEIEVDTLIGDAHWLPFDNKTFDAVLLHLVLSVVPDPQTMISEAARVLSLDGTISIYEKFVPTGTTPSVWRRVINPFPRFLFGPIQQLDPLVSAADLTLSTKESYLGGIYTVTTAHRSPSELRGTDPNE